MPYLNDFMLNKINTMFSINENKKGNRRRFSEKM